MAGQGFGVGVGTASSSKRVSGSRPMSLVGLKVEQHGSATTCRAHRSLLWKQIFTVIPAPLQTILAFSSKFRPISLVGLKVEQHGRATTYRARIT